MPNNQKVTRKLTAILSADVKGYSVLMSDDELHTIQTLKAYRSLMSDLIQNHSGRVVDNPGDNLLAEFSSAVDAVEAAVQIQNKLNKENAKFVEDRRLQFRIGVNIGDVVHDGDRIYGSGVNVAARIEGIADPGGICISRSTYDQIKNKLELETEYLGEHQVKNFEEPVRVYRVLMGTDTPKPLVEEELELPDRPSIAVLPFDNMSGDPAQEYFSDGLTEQIINGLCKVSNLFVIARNSSFAYKGKAVSVKQIAKELGVRYILEGSVQKADDRVRITAQLIDATTDYHMWSESYDKDYQDVFNLQDEITMRIIRAMDVNITTGEQARLWEGLYSSNIKSYDRVMRAIEYSQRLTKQDVDQSIKFAEEAVLLDDRNPAAYTTLGFSHWMKLTGGWSSSSMESFQKIEQCASKAIELSDSFDYAHTLSGCVHLLKGEFDKAVEGGEKALELNPNGADSHAIVGIIYCFCGETERSIQLFRKAIRLNPFPHSWYYHNYALALFLAGDYTESVNLCKKCLARASDSFYPQLYSAVSYANLGKPVEAKEAVESLLKVYPKYTMKSASRLAFKKKSHLDAFLDALRLAGLPD